MQNKTIALTIATLVVVSVLLFKLLNPNSGEVEPKGESTEQTPGSTVNDDQNVAPQQAPTITSNDEAIDGSDDLNERVSASDVFSSPLGTFGMNLDDVSFTYEENIEAARDGDPVSQYEVSRALFECKRIPTPSALENYVASGAIDAETGAAIQVSMDRCQKIIDNVPNILEESSRWLAESANTGFPLAKARHALFNPEDYSQAEIRDIMQAVISEQTADAYSMIVSYIANYDETNDVNYAAWSLIACEANPNCNINAYQSIESADYLPGIWELALQQADEIRKAVSDQRWNDIQF